MERQEISDIIRNCAINKNFMNKFEQIKNKYQVIKEEKGKDIIFKVLDKQKDPIGVATIELKKDRDGEKWYQLKNINSFTEKSEGVATKILSEINHFLQQESAIASGTAWSRRALKLFERSGWIAMESNKKAKKDGDRVAIFYNGNSGNK